MGVAGGRHQGSAHQQSDAGATTEAWSAEQREQQILGIEQAPRKHVAARDLLGAGQVGLPRPPQQQRAQR